MKKNISKSLPWIVLILLLMIRIWLGEKVGVQFYSDQVYDDQLLIRYGYLPSHFLEPNIDSLLKTMSYPLLLAFTKVSRIPYTIVLSFIWCITALYFASVFYRISNKNKIMGWCSFIYILFFPTAFELWQGTRLYRNAIIAPFVILCLSYMLIITWKNIKNRISYFDILYAVIFGFIFTFTYYIKEDGLWILACLLFTIVINFLIRIIKLIKVKRVRSFIVFMIVLCIPVVSFYGITKEYKRINEHYFGVAEIETRNGGELGEFVSLIYKIDSPNRTDIVWAPKDAIDKAWENSPTLQKYPQLYEAIIYTPWCEQDIEKNPIKGDFLTWVLRTALSDTGCWTNEKEMNDLFGKVNQEIKTAFKNGKIQKDSRIQLLSSAGGRTIEEIVDLKPIIIQEFVGAITLQGYESGAGAMGGIEPIEISEAARNITNVSYLTDYSSKSNNGISKLMVDSLFKIYSAINSFLFIAIILGIGFTVIRLFLLIKSRKKISVINMFLILSCIVFLGIGLAYSFAIAWFSDFIFVDGIDFLILNFYSIGLPAILSFAYFVNITNIYYFFKRRKTT